jgi:hypothetical protein
MQKLIALAARMFLVCCVSRRIVSLLAVTVPCYVFAKLDVQFRHCNAKLDVQFRRYNAKLDLPKRGQFKF